MKTTPLPLILLLSLLLLAPTAKAEGNETTEVTKTNWQDENVLANVSVGTDGTPTDVLVTLPDASDPTRADTLYTVKTAKGLAWIANITNNKDSVYQADDPGYKKLYPHQKGFKNCTVKLGADIDLNTHYWTPIGNDSYYPFNGTFDGNHKVVKGLKIEIKIENETHYNRSIYAGLFGRLQGDVHKLGIQVDAEEIKGKSQTVYAGALAGYNEGAIQNCFAIGNNSATIDAEAGIGYLGGLIGYMEREGSITNCYATLNIKGTDTGNGLVYAGGLVGFSKSQGNISHVYATGKIEATGQGYPYMGGVVGIAAGGTLSHALAANKDNITSANGGSLGRVCGNVYISDALCDTTTCYASTKIRVNGKVTGVGGSSIGKYFDGINADTDTDLGELFPTEGTDAVWESSTSNGNSTNNLPILKDFNSSLQTATEKTAVFDSPLDLSTLTANSGTIPTNETPTFTADSLIFSNTEGWIHKQGADGSRAAFSGRVKGKGTAKLAIKTDTAAVLSFKDGTELTGPTSSNAIVIDASQTTGKTTDVTLRSEGTVTVKGGGTNQFALTYGSTSSTCHIDPKNHFLFYGEISTNGGKLYNIISWTWSSAPTDNITVNWDGGSVTIPCGSDNSYKTVATNPGGDNITVRVGKDFQKGQLGDKTGNFVSTFNFVNSETRVSTSYYDMTSAADKGTADNPYIIDLAALSTGTTADGYTYTDADNRKIVTLNYTGSNDSVYYSIENQAANDAHILLTSAADLAKPLCLKARSGSFVDSLQVPAEADWTLKGDTLKASYVEVSGGLKLDGPVTVENTKNKTYNYALKVLSGGSVTANDVLKAYATGDEARAIRIEAQGTFTIGDEGKVYAFGDKYGYSSNTNGTLSINEGGILRSTSSTTAAMSYYTKVPAIDWSLVHKPETELMAEQGNEVIRFTSEMFGGYLDKAKSFAANVTANTGYTLYQSNVALEGVSALGDIVKTFSATNTITSYINVGIPTSKIENEKSITITQDGVYKDSEGTPHNYNNILVNTETSLLKIETAGKIAVDGVNVDSLVVKDGATQLYLNNDNRLDSIAIAEGKTLTLCRTSSTGTLTCSKIVNRGAFGDETGLIHSVTIPLASGDVYFSLETSADVEVARGGQTELKPSYKIPDGASVSYLWYEWKDNNWDWLNGSEGCTQPSYTLGAGKYKCEVRVTLSNASLKSTSPTLPTVTTTLTSYFTVTEKSTPPAPPVVIPSYYTVTLPAVEGATFSRATGETTVEEGTNFTFSITLDADYDQSVPVVTTSRGETIEPRASDGRYVVRDIQEDVVITVTGIRRNDDPTANAAVTPDAVRLWTASGQLHISTPVAADLRIYAFDGSLLRSLRLSAGETTMEAPGGPCIVVVGEHRFKVAR